MAAFRMNTERILGIPFFNGSAEDAVRTAARGGLVLCPSGPGLACDLLAQEAYREAVQAADLVLPDSGLMVLSYSLLTGKRIPRVSGLAFLRKVLEGPLREECESSFWVMPSEQEKERNLSWLAGQGIFVAHEDTYVAPRYGAGRLEDGELIEILRERRPKWIMLGIGGGVQERLGHFLRLRLDHNPSIQCIGAAIAFLAGSQASIPPWADRYYLGWLLRCMHRPAAYVPRYWNSKHLPVLIWKYRDEMPPLKAP